MKTDEQILKLNWVWSDFVGIRIIRIWMVLIVLALMFSVFGIVLLYVQLFNSMTESHLFTMFNLSYSITKLSENSTKKWCILNMVWILCLFLKHYDFYTSLQKRVFICYNVSFLFDLQTFQKRVILISFRGYPDVYATSDYKRI